MRSPCARHRLPHRRHGWANLCAIRMRSVQFLTLACNPAHRRQIAIRWVLVLCSGLAVPATAAPIDGDPVYRDRPHLAKVSRALLKSSAAAASDGAALRDGDGEPLVDVRLTGITPRLLAAAASAGLEIADVDLRHARLYGRCRGNCLAALAALPEVTAIHPNYGAATMSGNVVSQADQSIRAAAARSAFGVDGSGVRIGIISDTLTHRIPGNTLGSGCERSFTSTDAIAAAELPPVIYNLAEPRDIPGNPQSSISDEGRAMAELIHDLAPGADLYYHTAFSTPSVFVRAIDSLADCGVDVIVDDVIYFVEPMFQDGIIAQAAVDAIDRGILFFSAIGNLGTWGIDENYSDFSPIDDTTPTPSGNDLHVFANGSRFARVVIPSGCGLRMVMQWSEPFSGTLGAGASTDLDLYACTAPDPSSCTVLLAARDSQGCSAGNGGPSGDPIEILNLPPSSSSGDRTFYIAVEHVCGDKDVRFRVAPFAIGCFYPNRYVFDADVFNASPAYGHPVAAGVVSTAAVFYQEIDSGGGVEPPPGVINVEPFSSLGGEIPYYFDAAGNPLPAAPHAVTAPLLSAPDGTNTSFFGHIDVEGDGFRNFFGTSAAAPHAAAIAALVLEAVPQATAGEVLDILRATAIDIEAPGFDFRAGSGLIDAVAAVDEALRRVLSPSPSPHVPPPTATATVTPIPTRVAGCPGDCNGDARVSIDELIRAVRISLGEREGLACPPADYDGNGQVSIDELIQAVLASLYGCQP